MGLSMAVSTLVGQNIGAGTRAARTALLGNAIAFAVLSLAGILAYVFAPLLVSCREIRR